MAETSTSVSSAVDHLCVLVHGLWGNPNHLNYLVETLKAQHSNDRLHTLVPKSNSDNFTYDGIEVGGERITNEIEQTIKELELQGARIAKISIIGYSLGGLVSRYAIGLLYQNGVFDTVQPVNFTTFATPHLGIRTPKLGYRAQIFNALGSRTLSTSGQQMFLIDNFRGTGRPLLSLLADSHGVFTRGLGLFKNKSLYANTINDRSVPYYTASVSRTDPFVDLDKIDVHYLVDQPGEEEVLLDPAQPVTPRQQSADDKNLSAYSRIMPSQSTLNKLPFYMVLFTLMPIAVPAFLVNSVVQSYRSAGRVKQHEAGKAGISLGRYRMPGLLEEAQIAQDRVLERIAVDQAFSGGEEYLPTPPPEPSSGKASASASALPSTSSESATEDRDAKAALSAREAGKESSPFPLLGLTPGQFEMIDSLNALGFNKYLAHIQKDMHTHAAIIVRMPKPTFSEGKSVVKHWAAAFEV